MLRGFRNGVLLLLTGLVVAAPLFTTLTPSVAAAVQENPQDQLERWFYYRGMRACLEAPYFEAGNAGDDNETISVSDINEGHLYIQERDASLGSVGATSDQKEGFGYLASDLDDLDGDDGTVNCTDGSIWVRGASIFGFDNVINLICAMNAALEEPDLNQGSRIDPQRDGGKCEDAQEVFFDGDDSDIFQRALTRALESDIATKYGGDGDRPKITLSDNGGADYSWRALYYLLGKNSLETFCGGSLSDAKANNNYNGDDYSVSVYIVESDGTLKKSNVGAAGFSHSYTITNTDRNESDKVNDVYYKSGGNVNEADDVSCADMATLTREYAADYAKWAKNNKDLAEENENPTDVNDTTGGGVGESTCGIDGIGWIVCPIMVFLAEINDQAFGFLTKLLDVSPKLVQDTGTLQAWSTFRDFANVAFVIAFMVIVYSQLTSAGIANYGVKKMLPKIVIAAILVNISYFICAIMVDLSNIVGSSIYQLFINIGGDATTGAGEEGSTWSSIIGSLLIAGVVAALIVALILAPTALLALALIVLILVARQALVIVLIILSPLAFVAYLLPNTEDWFKKWWKAFVTVLMVYPIVGAVFGASNMISNILMGIAGDGGDGGDDEQLLKLVALGVLAIPLFAVPAILKGSLSAMGNIGTKVAGWSNKADGYAKNKAMQGRIGEAKTSFNRWQQGRKAERRAGIGNGIRARTNRAFDSTRLGRAVGGAQGAARATAEYDKSYDEDVKAAGTLLQARLGHMDILNAASSGSHNGKALTEHERTAALQYAMERGNYNERRNIVAGRDMDGNVVGGGIGTMSRTQRKAAINGMRAKGDTAIHGNAALAALEATDEHGTTNHTAAQAEATLAGGTAEAINSGTLSVEAAAKDFRTAAYVAEVASGARSVAGDVTRGAGTGNRTAVTTTARTNLQTAVTDFTTNEHWTKLDANTQSSLRSI